MAYLILVRHGRSEWNDKGLWTGWTDIPMTDEGFKEVERTAKVIKELPFHIDVAYLSPLIRSKQTLDVILKELPQQPEIRVAPEITERDYGIYTGKNKWEVKEEVGEEEFQKIRRSWNYPIPNGESLEKVYERIVPFYKSDMLPLLKNGKNILVSGHGNSLRALIKYLEGISDEDISKLEIHTGEAWIYKIGPDGTVQSKEIRAKNDKKV